MNITHPFLEHHDVKYLDVDTLKYPNGVASTFKIDNTKPANETEWIHVNNKKRTSNKTITETTNQVRRSGGILRQSTQPNGKNKRKSNGNHDTDKNDNTPSPAANDPPPKSAKETPLSENNLDEEEMDIEDASCDSIKQPSQASRTPPAITEVIPPHPNIPTNDGTYRITVRWTAPSDVRECETDKNRLNEALHTLMTTLFQDSDGIFYRWESEDLAETKAASSLSPTIARDFVSPKVTFIGSKSMMIFGIRFGFESRPGKWQHSERTKTILKEQHLNVLVSNSKSTSGDLVTAGYILLKAPNTTHRHFYT